MNPFDRARSSAVLRASRSLLLAVSLLASFGALRLRGAEPPPNVVLFLIDDLGWSDLGCYGNRFHETARIDRLAREGVRFTDFYAATPVCSSTRVSIQSGLYPARVGLTNFSPGHWRPFEKLVEPPIELAMSPETVTVAEVVKEAGYATGYVGKWHLAHGRDTQPDRQGYDLAVVTGGGHLAGRYRAGLRVGTELQPRPGQLRSEYEAEVALEFLQKNRARPFFLMVSPFLVHVPLEAARAKVEKYEAKPKPAGGVNNTTYAAMVEHADDLVGRVLDGIERHGLAARTVVIFTSDNGGLHKLYTGDGVAVTTNAPLRNEKGSLYEGGIRVPLVVRWPGVVAPGSLSREVAISQDLYPTIAEITGGKLPAGWPADARSLVPLLGSPSARLGRGAIYFHYPHYHHSRPSSAVRRGDWKLVEFFDTGKLELYDLAGDIGETRDLSAAMPRLARELARDLERWRREVGARLPGPNPAWRPKRAGEWWSRTRLEPIDRSGLRRLGTPVSE